jgi:hypothetical protein
MSPGSTKTKKENVIILFRLLLLLKLAASATELLKMNVNTIKNVYTGKNCRQSNL